MEKIEILTREQARQHAIDWQNWASEQDLSWNEISDWVFYFNEMAIKFDLLEEFKENGIT